MVTGPQIIVLLLAVLAYLAGGAGSALGLMGRKVPRWWRWTCLLSGIALSATLLGWHSLNVVNATGTWQPLNDNFSSMLILAFLLAGFVGYMQIRRPIMALDWLMMPVVVLFLLLAGHFGKTQPAAYIQTTYSVVHALTSYLGTLAFVVAGASGSLYLMADRRLRHRKAGGVPKPPDPGRFGSLERLERLTRASVTVGFALLTIGIVTGVAWVLNAPGGTNLGHPWFASPKVILTAAVWLVFGAVLHSPISLRLRGRRNAILSIVGAALTLAALFAALLIQKGAN